MRQECQQSWSGGRCRRIINKLKKVWGLMMDCYRDQLLESARNREEYLRQIADHLYHLRQKFVKDDGVSEDFPPFLRNESFLEINDD